MDGTLLRRYENDMNRTGNTILITGGGTGIGCGLAEAFHHDGNQIIIAERLRSVLEDTAHANPGMRFFTAAVEKRDDAKRFGAEVKAQFPDLNVLINNVGIMKSENLKLGTEDLAIAEQTVAVNLLSTLRVTAALMPLLLSQPKATITAVSSALAFLRTQPKPRERVGSGVRLTVPAPRSRLPQGSASGSTGRSPHATPLRPRPATG
ncbi:MAG: SDR family NAD(P)-dependent oxidoreductase [Acetobacteraceae bacterium]